MYFVVLGVLLIASNLAGIGPLADLVWPGDWWKMCWPFGLALIWWFFADATGYTKRKEIEKMDERVAKRRKESLEKLGMDHRGRRKKRKV
jgi:small Trp-rich protein